MALNDLARRLWGRLDLGEFKNLTSGRGEFNYLARVNLSKFSAIYFQDVKEHPSSLVYSEDDRSWTGIRQTSDGKIYLYHQMTHELRHKSSERLIASGFIGAMLDSSLDKDTEKDEHFLYQMEIPSVDVAEDFFVNFIRQGPSAPRSTEGRTAHWYKPGKRQQSK